MSARHFPSSLVVSGGNAPLSFIANAGCFLFFVAGGGPSSAIFNRLLSSVTSGD